MATPTIVEIEGSNSLLRSWVFALPSALDLDNRGYTLLEYELGRKDFNVGVSDSMVLIHCARMTSSANSRQNLHTVFGRLGMDIKLGEAAAFSLFHAELFGFRHIVGSPERESRVPHIRWLASPPLKLEMVMSRRTTEAIKLEWIFLRAEALGNHSLRCEPGVLDWPMFFEIYSGISHISEHRHVKTHAQSLFLEHCKSWCRGITREDLIDEKAIVDGECFKCNKTIPHSWEMDGAITTNLGQVIRQTGNDTYCKDKSKCGRFCSPYCARGKCRGCTLELGPDGNCAFDCGDDQKRNKRRRCVPLGSGDNGMHSREYVNPIDFNFAVKGCSLRWPGCEAKSLCMFHTCHHVCTRDCAHECDGCRVNSSNVEFGSQLCGCKPEWIEKQLQIQHQMQDA